MPPVIQPSAGKSSARAAGAVAPANEAASSSAAVTIFMGGL